MSLESGTSTKMGPIKDSVKALGQGQNKAVPNYTQMGLTLTHMGSQETKWGQGQGQVHGRPRSEAAR